MKQIAFYTLTVLALLSCASNLKTKKVDVQYRGLQRKSPINPYLKNLHRAVVYEFSAANADTVFSLVSIGTENAVRYCNIWNRERSQNYIDTSSPVDLSKRFEVDGPLFDSVLVGYTELFWFDSSLAIPTSNYIHKSLAYAIITFKNGNDIKNFYKEFYY